MTREITRNDLQAALPDLTSPLTLPGLREPVQVFRDRVGHPPHPRRKRVGPVLRTGLRHRPGPPLAHGRRPPPGPRPLVGDRRRGRPEAGPSACAPPAWDRAARARPRGQQSGGPRHGPGVRRRGQRLHRHDQRPARGILTAGEGAGAVGGLALRGGVQDPQHSARDVRGEVVPHAAGGQGPGGTTRQANEGVSARQSAHRGLPERSTKAPFSTVWRASTPPCARPTGWARSRPAPTAGPSPAG